MGVSIDVVCPRCGVIGKITYYSGVVIKGMNCICGSPAIATNNGIHHRLPLESLKPAVEPECRE
jgi:hypothetical protein